MEVLSLIIAVIALMIAVAAFMRAGGVRELKHHVQTLSSRAEGPPTGAARRTP